MLPPAYRPPRRGLGRRRSGRPGGSVLVKKVLVGLSTRERAGTVRRLILPCSRSVSLKCDPDYQSRERAALALKFYLCGLSGLEIRQIARFRSDPNDGPVGDLEGPVPLF